MKDALDFAAINQAALAAFPAVLARILPGGKRVGARDRRAQSAPRRSPARIVQDQPIQRALGGLRDGRQGRRSDCRLSPISRTSRRARRRGCSRGCSASKPGGRAMDDGLDFRALVRCTNLKRRRKRRAHNGEPDAAKPTCPPADAEAGADAAARLFGRPPDAIWRYATRKAQPRFMSADGTSRTAKRTFGPLSWFEGERLALRALAGSSAALQPREIRRTPTRPLSFAEGEKAADAAARDLSQVDRDHIERRRASGAEDAIGRRSPAGAFSSGRTTTRRAGNTRSKSRRSSRRSIAMFRLSTPPRSPRSIRTAGHASRRGI